jgi:hypothetical protein
MADRPALDGCLVTHDVLNPIVVSAVVGSAIRIPWLWFCGLSAKGYNPYTYYHVVITHIMFLDLHVVPP